MNGIDDHRLCKHHNVKVRSHPGGTTRDIADHVKPVARRKPDMVIIHCGTNEFTNDFDTTKHLEEVAEILKEESPHSKIVMSAAMMRSDGQGMEKKIDELRCKVKAVCVEQRLDFFNNSNVDNSCLGQNGLHLNLMGNTAFTKLFRK